MRAAVCGLLLLLLLVVPPLLALLLSVVVPPQAVVASGTLVVLQADKSSAAAVISAGNCCSRPLFSICPHMPSDRELPALPPRAVCRTEVVVRHLSPASAATDTRLRGFWRAAAAHASLTSRGTCEITVGEHSVLRLKHCA